MCDMLAHGLRSLLGPDFVDVNKLTFMYQGEPHPPFFTVYATLPDIPVDREDILHKIRTVYFDAVIYGSIQRYREHLPLVTEIYPPERIAFIDGEDDHVVFHDALGRGHYFKRELDRCQHDSRILPIEFCIPKEKIRPTIPTKTHLMAPCDPRDRATYRYYASETSYYDQYAVSYFGYTMKKGGWDSCRHYEIMAAGALPYFADLESCPLWTLNWFPKTSLLVARVIHDNWKGRPEDEDDWAKLMSNVRTVLANDLTTEAMAKRILEKLS